MKLRIRANTIRFRLSQTEVARLASGGRVEQVTQFPASASLISSVETSPGISAPTAGFEGNRLRLVLPVEQTKLWADSDQVGIAAAQDLENGRLLELLIEKDFECLASHDAPDIDAYPNPQKVADE
jgi:hypothetical protein